MLSLNRIVNEIQDNEELILGLDYLIAFRYFSYILRSYDPTLIFFVSYSPEYLELSAPKVLPAMLQQ